VSWTCPACERTFKNENQPHSCGRYTVEQQFEGKPGHIVALYHVLEEAVTACGPCEIDPAKTAILMKRKVPFVSVKFRKQYLLVGIRLFREVDSPLVQSVFEFRPGLYENRIRLCDPAEIDETFRSWLQEAWRDAA
jgi:hypothetical protein